ncbi:MAG TPA: ATP-binding protein, partial [bacterium]|nr:ATP-binding protein [bacterium]
MTRWLPRTLAGRIGGALIVASIAPTVVAGVIAVRETRKNLSEAARQYDLALVSTLAQDLNTLLQESRRSLDVASVQPALQQPGAARTQLLGALARHEPLFRSVYLLAPDGKLIEGAGGKPGLRQLRPTSWGGYVTDAYNSDDDGTPIVTVIITVRDGSLRDAGYLCGDIDLAFVSDTVKQMPVPATASLLVVDANRRVIASRSPLPGGSLAALAAPAIARVNASLEPDAFTYSDSDGRQWLAAYRNMGVYDEFRGLRWGIIVQQETRDAFALARRTAATTVVVTVVFAIACIVAGRVLARRFAGHLSRLGTQADRLAEGHAVERLFDAEMPEEIGHLAQRFDEMAARVASSKSALERRGDELEELNRQLQELHNLVSSLVRAIPVGVASVDREGRLQTVNPAGVAMAGAKDERSLIGRTLLEFAPARALPELEPAMRRVLAGEAFDRTWNQAPLPDGATAVRLRVRMTPLKPAGEVTGAVVLIEDLSEQARMESTLVRSEKLSSVGVLAAGVAHEINNPLTAILGYSRLLLERVKESDPSYSALSMIASEAERVHVIIRNLLDFSMPRATELTPVDVTAAVAKILPVLAPQFRKANIKVETKLDERLPSVRGDEGRIQQVFVNLVRNAIDAAAGGRVTVATGRRGGKVWIEVADSGPGIPSDVIGRIFDPFFTTKGAGRGTGLGLSISYGIAQEHGGTIEVESTPGAGARFRFVIPADA